MLELTAEHFAQRITDTNLLDERQIESIWSELGSREASGEAFKTIAVRRQLLTNYQIEKLIRGDRSGFFYGDYKTLYLVGSGTFARVYRAVHRRTNQVVALKVLRNRFSSIHEETQNFLREGRMGKTLRHPNIVPISEVNSSGRSHYIVMEFVEGRNLREFVKVRKKLSPVEATDFTAQMADGLDYAFKRGITHRDLKLSNVLVSSRGLAQLVDFGLAAASGKSMINVEDHPNERAIDYAGLERTTNVRRDDKRSDVYFLGCMYYHMLTGIPPLQETRHRVQRLSVSRFRDVIPITHYEPNLSQHLLMVVNKAMQLNPSSRYQTPGEMCEDLKITAKRIGAGVELSTDNEAGGSSAELLAMHSARNLSPSHTVMVIESDTEMQDLLRERLKKRGFRVLVTSDPTRAIGRFETAEGRPPAECVVFSSRELGKAAVKGFNLFGELKKTRGVPAILLLDENHADWRKEANLSARRRVLQMPVRVSQLQAGIHQLLKSTN